ncbi:hemerythrin domain-containing protein [Thioalkalivibrio sp.]|uniref:hemerythrin domain-containing protein n=1 Tax=Thioalkalivibrio sp. TaxID=2093813 RepID=UPI00397632E3
MVRMEGVTPGFDDPLGVLRACHRRIAERLDLLERLPEYVELHGADASAQSAAQRVLNYFDRAAGNHHEDEEADLFPMLRRAKGRQGWDDAVPAALEQLTAEHERLARRWAQIRPSLASLARGEHTATLSTEALVRDYRAHMAVEDELILPVAAHVLDHGQLQRLGVAMQRRRGLSPRDSAGETAE